MFLKIYKTNQAYLILLIPITAILLWLTGFIDCNLESFTANRSVTMPLYALFDSFINSNCYLSLATALILALAQGFYLSNLNKNFIFIKQRSYLHSFIFLLIISSSVLTRFATPAIFANFFILFSINWLFHSYKKVRPNTELFNSGLFLSIASLFYLNSLLLLPLLLFAYIILHTVKFKEFLVIISGFITPLILTAGVLFINDKLFIYTESIWNYITQTNYNFNNNIFSYIFYGWLILLLFIAILSFSNNFGTKKISSRKFLSVFLYSSRKFLSVFLYLTFYNIGIYFLLPFSNMEMMVITAAPISLLITDFYINMTNKFWSEFSFAILIISFILLQVYV